MELWAARVLRRILRKIAEGPTEALGDRSSLADPEVVETIKADIQGICERGTGYVTLDVPPGGARRVLSPDLF